MCACVRARACVCLSCNKLHCSNKGPPLTLGASEGPQNPGVRLESTGSADASAGEYKHLGPWDHQRPPAVMTAVIPLPHTHTHAHTHTPHVHYSAFVDLGIIIHKYWSVIIIYYIIVLLVFIPFEFGPIFEFVPTYCTWLCEHPYCTDIIAISSFTYFWQMYLL